MQKIKSKCQRAISRLGNSAFARKGMLAMGAVMLTCVRHDGRQQRVRQASPKPHRVSSYQTPVSNLMKAIAAVIVLVGAFNVYFKMQNGDQDVKRRPSCSPSAAVSPSSH